MNPPENALSSTMPPSLKQSSWSRPKYLLFAAIGLMLAYVIPHDESFLVHPKDPMWQHYEPFKVVAVAAGNCRCVRSAVLIGI